MRPRPSRTSLAATLLLLVSAGCTSDALTTAPPAAVDVSGFWAGPWNEEEGDPDMPGSGQVFLSFTQGSLGAVSGVVTFEGIPCLGTHPFTGTVDGQALQGTVSDPGVRVAFLIDASKSMIETETRLEGTFTIELGTALEDEPCSGLEGAFVALKDAPAPGSPGSAPAPLVGAPRLVPFGDGQALAWPVHLRDRPGRAPRLWLQPLDGGG